MKVETMNPAVCAILKLLALLYLSTFFSGLACGNGAPRLSGGFILSRNTVDPLLLEFGLGGTRILLQTGIGQSDD
jgi:hypothetical protein